MSEVFFTNQITEELINYLKHREIINDDEALTSIEKFNGGNMNLVMRITTSKKSFIFKQARPWVEKYPHVAAPVNRIAIEASFYKCLHQSEYLMELCPQLLNIDLINHILIIEDLGNSSDYSFLYKEQKQLSLYESNSLVNFLVKLHQLEFDHYPANTEMKTLNHEHIFNFPYLEENGFNLDNIIPGLQQAAMEYKTNQSLKSKIHRLGEMYLHSDANVLLQGDFYPGSWLKTQQGIKFIDHEFSFKGLPAFDMGVFIAHLYMTLHDEDFINAAISYYQNENHLDISLCRAFAGVEIMRRILGLAQLPITLDLNQRISLLTFASQLI